MLMERCQKVPKLFDKINFLVKNYPNLSQFFFMEEYEFKSTFFCYRHFLNTSILKSLYFLHAITYLNQNVLEILSSSLPSLFMENWLFMSTTALRDIDTPGAPRQI